MRRSAHLILGLALAIGATDARAATQPTLWQGVAIINAVSGCSNNLIKVGNAYEVVYRPIIAGVQTLPEGLSFSSGHSSALFVSTQSHRFHLQATGATWAR